MKCGYWGLDSLCVRTKKGEGGGGGINRRMYYLSLLREITELSRHVDKQCVMLNRAHPFMWVSHFDLQPQLVVSLCICSNRLGLLISAQSAN